MPIQTVQERERQRRIQVCIWAYSYEELCASIVDDATFDRVCKEIDTDIATDNPTMDAWFKKNFDPSTGSWVGRHPYPLTLRVKAIQLLSSMEEPYFDNIKREWVRPISSEPLAKVEKMP